MTASLPNASTAEDLGGYERIADAHGRNHPDASAAIDGPDDPDRQIGDRRRLPEKERQPVLQLKQRGRGAGGAEDSDEQPC